MVVSTSGEFAHGNDPGRWPLEAAGLSYEQLTELIDGPADAGSAFADDEQRRLAWNLFAAQVEVFAQDWVKPWARRRYGDPATTDSGPLLRRWAAR